MSCPAIASVDLNTNHFSVELELDSTILGDLAIAPNPFTPNGDSLNDRMRIQYSIFKLVQPVSVEAAIYDLAGRRVRALFNGMQSSGFHAVEWDGRASQGSLAAPGLYVCRISVDSAMGANERAVPVALVY